MLNFLIEALIILCFLCINVMSWVQELFPGQLIHMPHVCATPKMRIEFYSIQKCSISICYNRFRCFNFLLTKEITKAIQSLGVRLSGSERHLEQGHFYYPLSPSYITNLKWRFRYLFIFNSRKLNIIIIDIVTKLSEQALLKLVVFNCVFLSNFSQSSKPSSYSEYKESVKKATYKLFDRHSF